MPLILYVYAHTRVYVFIHLHTRKHTYTQIAKVALPEYRIIKIIEINEITEKLFNGF